MSSRAASAFVPSSRTVAPLMVTRPSLMIFSAPRRDATPARDRIFCSLSSTISMLTHSRARSGIGEPRRLPGHHLPLAAAIHPDVGVAQLHVQLLPVVVHLDRGQARRHRRVAVDAQLRILRPDDLVTELAGLDVVE